MAKLVSQSRPERTAQVSVEGAGLVVQLGREEAEVLFDDAARKVLVQGEDGRRTRPRAG